MMPKEPTNIQENYIKRKEWAIEILKHMKSSLSSADYSETEEQIYNTALDIAIWELEISVTNQ